MSVKVRYRHGAMGGVQGHWDGSDMSVVWFGHGSALYLVMPNGSLVRIDSYPVPENESHARSLMAAFVAGGK